MRVSAAGLSQASDLYVTAELSRVWLIAALNEGNIAVPDGCQRQMGCGMDRPRPPEVDDEKSYDMGGGIALILAIVFIPILLIDFVAMIWAR